MSKYDEERNKILERMQKSNVSFAPDAAPSKYKADRSASSVTSKYDYDRMNNDPIPNTSDPAQEQINHGAVQGLTKTFDMLRSGTIPELQPSPEPERPGRDIPIVGSVLRDLDAFADNPITKKVGELGQMVYTPGAGVANVAGLFGAAGVGISKIAPKLSTSLGGRVAQGAIQAGVTEAPVAMGNALSSQTQDIGEAAQMGLIGGGLGAVGGAAGPLIGRGIQSLRASRGVAEAMPQETLALPPASRYESARSRAEGTVLPANETPIYGQGDVHTFALPEPDVLPPTRARLESRVNPYEQKLNQLFEVAKQENMPPGRERETLDDLWSRMAGPNDPSLDELIDLAYPKRTSRLSTDLASKSRQQQQMREVAGAPNVVRSMDDRYQPYVGEAAAPETKVGFQRVEVTPPKRKFPKEPAVLKAELPPSTVDNLDDIIPDETPHPRVRDKLTSYADDLINSAKAELAAGRNRLSSNPVDVYAQYGKLGAGYMLKGSVKLADFTEVMVKEFGESIRPHVREIFKRSKDEYKTLKFNVEKQELGINKVDPTALKDVSNLRLNTSDVYRNFQAVFGKNYDSVKKSILDPFDGAKRSYVDTQKKLAGDLHQTIVKGLGITKGSKESALVQKLGEKQITLDELKQQAPKNWQKIVQADQWFRQKYDTLIDQVNQTVKKIYPTNPDKIVPKRENYYRHFRELNGLSGLRNLFESPSQIDPKLSGISPFTTPKTKWASFKQKRGMGEFKNDAVGGFLEYIPAASYAVHIDPQINVFRTLAKNLAEQTTDSRNVNNFIKFLNNFSNDLAGKTSPFDRWVEEIGGRKTLQVITWANNRVKSNVILGNVRSTLAQMANIPQGVAFAKHHSAEGAMQTVASVFRPNEAMQNSTFLRERYVGKDFRRFNTKLIEQPRRFAEWMMETSDRVGTSFVWNSAYAKGKALKVEDPAKYADDHTRRLVAGRGVGEAPLLQKSKVFQVIAPFQLEVANLWKVMREFVSEKDFAGIATLFAANFLLNKGVEKVTGSGVTFDPIDAVWDAATEKDISAFERAGRVGGEILSNVPLGQTMAGMYPEFGTNLYGVQLPTRKKLFGDNDPTRFGEGLVLTKGIQDPLFKMVLPFGGNQLKKTIGGADALARGGAYTENVMTTGKNIEDKKLKYSLKNTPAEISRGLLFGAPATGSGQEYYKNDRRPLSATQTNALSKSSNPDKLYNTLQQQREIDTQKRKIDDIRKDKTMPVEKKRQEITRLSTKIQQLQQQSAK